MTRGGGVWARGFGVTLHRHDGPLSEGIVRALRDAIERGYEGPLPGPPAGVERFEVRANRERVGLLAFERRRPEESAATFLAVAIEPERRGRDYGARALLATERRLRRDGLRTFYARVPRTNGRGLYFMLRAGYAPAPAPAGDDGRSTWFRRFVPAATRGARGTGGSQPVRDREPSSAGRRAPSGDS